MSLKGRVALVTGGGRGIGKGISLCLAEAGATIAINYRRDEDAAKETAAEIAKMGGTAKIYSASVENYDEDEKMIDAIIKDFGKVDILINNAGIASRGQSIYETDPAEMERVVRTHAFGSYYCSKLVLPSMRKQPRGDIVMISSVGSQAYGANGAPYAMGKVAQEAVAFVLAKEEQKNNIHVNVVCPGLIDTDMGRRLAKATRGVGDIHELDASSPFGRVGSPEDIGKVVRFFVSDEAGYVTGQRINVDGGATPFH